MGGSTRITLSLGLLKTSAALPLFVSHAIGASLGWLLWLLPNKQRRVAELNLALCLPEWGAKQRRQLLRRNLIETGKGVLELGSLWFWPADRIIGLVQEIRGESAWQEALSRSQGAIVITPHLGAWELTGLYISSRYPMTALYRPSKLGPRFDSVVQQARQRAGGHLVATDPQGIRQLLKALRAGEVIGILPDQDPGNEGGIFAPFFGQAANTMVLLSRLALKSQAPVFIAYSERLAYGRGFRIIFRPLPDVRAGSLEDSVAAVNTAIEQAVRELPKQYLWSYKRFKRQPPGLTPPY